jgi:hypothetical protein
MQPKTIAHGGDMTLDIIDQRKIATELSQRAIDRIITIGGKVK